MACTIKVFVAGSVAFLEPTGELSRDSTPIVVEAVKEAVRARRIVAIAITFREVTALLSEGIRMLIALNDAVEKSKRIFHITDLPPEVEYTLKITNLLSFLNHKPTAEDVLLQYSQLGAEWREVSLGKSPETAAKTSTPTESLAPPAPQKPAVKSKPEVQKPGEAAKSSTPEEASPEKPKPAPVKEKEHSLEMDQAKDLIHKYIPGRTYVDVLDYFIARQKSVADVETISKGTGHKPGPLKDVMHDMVHRGVLQAIGGGTYNYAPAHELEPLLHAFITDWHTPSKHARLLAAILTEER